MFTDRNHILLKLGLLAAFGLLLWGPWPQISQERDSACRDWAHKVADTKSPRWVDEVGELQMPCAESDLPLAEFVSAEAGHFVHKPTPR